MKQNFGLWVVDVSDKALVKVCAVFTGDIFNPDLLENTPTFLIVWAIY